MYSSSIKAGWGVVEGFVNHPEDFEENCPMLLLVGAIKSLLQSDIFVDLEWLSSRKDLGGDSMDGRKSWIGRDGWWRKQDWTFKVKFAEETYNKVKEDDNSELQLQDVVQFVTHVQGIRADVGQFAILFDAMKSGGVSLLPNLKPRHKQVTEVGILSLAESLSSGKLPNLSRLDISYNDRGNEGAKSVGLAIRCGELKNLAELVLKGSFIGDEGLTALAESFQDGVVSVLPNLNFLALNRTYFTEVGMLSLAESLSSGKLPNLTRLDISDNDIGHEGAKSLGLAIRSGELKNLAELVLNSTFIGDEGLTALAESFQDGVVSLLPNLKSLNLRDNIFTEVGMLSLAESLSSGKLPNLTRLDISDNRIGNEGAKSLGLAIRSGELKNLAELVLKGTFIGDEGLTALAESFQDSVVSLLPNLKSLNLRHNNFTEVGMLSLTESLSSGKLPNLSRLDISDSFIGNEGAKSLGLAIRSGELKNLAELDLQRTGIGDEGLTALAESFQDGMVSLLPNLKSLNLCGIYITEVGMLSLAESLSSGKLPNLSRLDISHNDIGNEGAKSLGLAIRSGELKTLALLDLQRTGIGDEGLTALAESFQDGVVGLLPKLSSLNLFGNSFADVGLMALAEVLKSGRLNLLKVLDVRNLNNWSKKGPSALVSALSTNNCLTADVMFEWHKFPDLDRRRQQLTKRNSRNRDILEGLVTVPKVQATFGKVYICGNAEVGKTTLRRTLQRSFWESLFTWETKSHVEVRTRGIDVSQFSSKASKPDENPITLLVWDMAGQEDFHLVHNAFFPDLGFAEGKATTFIVVCRSNNSLQQCMEQLEYWLRYIASSCDKAIQNPRQVFVLMNNIGGDRKIHRDAEQWKLMLEGQRDKFEQHLQIQTTVFLIDVREFKQVDGLKSCILEHTRNMLRNQEVPDICQAIQQNLNVLSLQMEHFPVLHWKEFVEQVQQLLEPWSEEIIEAATKYLTEVGVIIYIHTEGVRLVVVNPNWFCSEIIGNFFLPSEMASPRELIFRDKVDQSTGSISISSFKKFFKSLEGEWNDTQVDDMIAILLWLGLSYKGNDENVFIPALIAKNGTPGGPWALQTQVEHGGKHWVMGFSVRHCKTEVALAPISLWHRFQVDLAQTLKFESETPDNNFVADKHFMTFVKDYMNVLIEVDANLDKPTFEEIIILVRPSFKREELDAAQSQQWQVDLADDLVERLLKLWNQYCPGVEHVTKVIWPWPTSCSRPEDMTDRNVDVDQVKIWVKKRGVGRQMQWLVGSVDSITEDQLLSTKDKKWFASSKTSGINGHARQVNDSVFELYSPKNTTKVQIVFFHGLQMEEYSDAHLSAWQSADGSTIWPQTWLVEDICGARVLSISYSGGLFYRSDGSLDMYNIGENLLSDLLQDGVWPGIGEVPQCPVVLVGHSIGGLVIKALCYHAHDKLHRSQGSERTKFELFLKSVGGIFYYATPHHGSLVEKILAKKISNPLLTYFETLSKDTARLNGQFEDICKAHYKHWSFAGLGEAVPTNLGPLKGGVAPEKYWVVPEASARGENFNVVEEADHFSVCRPRSKRVRSFTKLRNFVSQIASDATDAVKIKPANPLPGSSSSGDVSS